MKKAQIVAMLLICMLAICDAEAQAGQLCDKRHTDNLDAYFEVSVDEILKCVDYKMVSNINFMSTVLDESSPVAVLFYNNDERSSKGFAAAFHLLSKTVNTIRYAAYKVSEGAETPAEASRLKGLYQFSGIPAIVFYSHASDGVEIAEIFGQVAHSDKAKETYLKSLDIVASDVLHIHRMKSK